MAAAEARGRQENRGRMLSASGLAPAIGAIGAMSGKNRSNRRSQAGSGDEGIPAGARPLAGVVSQDVGPSRPPPCPVGAIGSGRSGLPCDRYPLSAHSSCPVCSL